MGRITQEEYDAYEGPEVPDAVWHYWSWFEELDIGRGFGMHGANALGWTEIESWSRLTGRTLSLRDAKTLILIDICYRNPGKPPEKKEE